MNPLLITPKQQGFLLPVAIFLLVVLAGLGAYAVNIYSVQQFTSSQDVLGVRAYHAARAGVEFSSYQILRTPTLSDLPDCPATTTLSLNGFQVIVSCTQSTDFFEQGEDHTIRIYQIVSTATLGTVNTANYVERQIQVTLSKCKGTDEEIPYQCL